MSLTPKRLDQIRRLAETDDFFAGAIWMHQQLNPPPETPPKAPTSRQGLSFCQE